MYHYKPKIASKLKPLTDKVIRYLRSKTLTEAPNRSVLENLNNNDQNNNDKFQQVDESNDSDNSEDTKVISWTPELSFTSNREPVTCENNNSFYCE